MRRSVLHGSVACLLGILVASAAAAPPASSTKDPRVELVETLLTQDPATTLRRLDELASAHPEPAEAAGFSYVKAWLLERDERKDAGRRDAARRTFGEVRGQTPALAPWATYRLARSFEADGEAATAAGLAATLLGSRPPKSLVEPTTELLHRALEQAGDCRVLRGLQKLRLKDRDRRRLVLAQAACARRAGETERERVLLGELLAEDPTDDPAHVAAGRLHGILDLDAAETGALVDLGAAFYHHREFEPSARLFERALAREGSDLSPNRRLDTRYDLGRSYFWLRRYERAAQVFGELARDGETKRFRAKALYQQARTFELLGSSLATADGPGEKGGRAWERAAELFGAVTAADPTSGWSSAALVGRMRLQELLGRREDALASLGTLREQGSVDNLSRALLFLAVSDVVRERPASARPLLAAALRTGGLPDQEAAYWRGRLAELEGRAADAVADYAEVLAEDPFHPFGEAARSRLAAESLSLQVLEAAEWLAAGPGVDALYKAWLLLGDQDPRGVAARKALYRALAEDPKASPYLDLKTVPPAEWPLWQKRLTRPEELFLALGLFGEAPTPVLRHFPVAEPALAFTGSTVLATGGSTRRSLYIAEILRKRAPDRVPTELLPVAFRERLYPFRYSYLILREASKREIDPYLLAGLIREESRFDADAFSGASARGLTQFIFPTAREIAEEFELGPIRPRDVHRPEIAVALGAAYLRRLSNELHGDLDSMVAAYNAGEPQAELWKRYCFTDEPEEYWSKVAFRETRNYVRKVLTSRAHYRELYGKKPAETKPGSPGSSR